MPARAKRYWILWMLAAVYFLTGVRVPACCGAAPETGRPAATLTSRRGVGAIDRVEILLEVAGDLKLGEGPGATTPVTHKMKTVAQLVYEEKTTAVAGPPGRSIRAWRYYDRAEADIKVGQDAFTNRLRSTRRLVGAEVSQGKTVLFSPRGTLSRDELDLLDVLGNSLVLENLLPEGPVAVGDRWKVPPEAVGVLFGVEPLERCESQASLAELTEAWARIELSGELRGKTTGQPTAIRWKGRCRYDRLAGRVDWFALSLHEDRVPGLLGPGLDVLATLQVRIVPQAKPQHLTEEMVRDLPQGPTPALLRLGYVSADGGWQLEYDRRWMLIAEQGGMAVFRLADGGQYVAQCTIVAQGADGEGKAVSLAQFQDEIRQALGKNFGQFVRASQSPRPEGGLWYRVEVEGTVADLPVKWLYAMLQGGGGRRAVLAFVIEGAMVERFGQADQELIAAFRLADPKVAAKPAAP